MSRALVVCLALSASAFASATRAADWPLDTASIDHRPEGNLQRGLGEAPWFSMTLFLAALLTFRSS